MDIKTTFTAATAVLALSAFSVSAATVLTVGSAGDPSAQVEAENQLDGSLALNFKNTLVNDDFELDQAFNLREFEAILFDPKLFGTGSLTLSTFVDPFIEKGVGAADLLLRVNTSLAANSVTVQWGDGDVLDLSSGAAVNLATTFEQPGISGARDLVFRFNDLVRVEQLSSNLAVSAVPVPAGLLLLGTALGGLGVARRRKNKKADA